MFVVMNFQTGSGKTFTITGGAERYADRGIIPRTLSYVYEYYSQVSGQCYYRYAPLLTLFVQL
jgi:kinesin family protein 6/9